MKSSNIALIIESSIEKTPTSGSWISNFDCYGLIINCSTKGHGRKNLAKKTIRFLPKDLLPICLEAQYLKTMKLIF